MRDTIILTLFDRPEWMLVNTLISVCKNDLRDTEVLIVEDGCTYDYSRVYAEFGERFELRVLKRDSVKDVGAYNIDGHNNPAYVNNVAISEARGERLFWLSSDVMLQPKSLARARSWDAERYVYVPRVVDLDTSHDFNPLAGGPTRNGFSRHVFPMCWFQMCSRGHAEAIGGFDETYCQGLAFEDNDWIGRLGLRVGQVVSDMGAVVWHQSHPRVAYSDNLVGFYRSKKYTFGKWGGVPWSKDYPDPIKKQMRQVADCLVFEVSCDRVPGDRDGEMRDEGVREVCV